MLGVGPWPALWKWLPSQWRAWRCAVPWVPPRGGGVRGENIKGRGCVMEVRKQLLIPYCELTQVPAPWQRLLAAARGALSGSYSPYSGFRVAAALEMEEGGVLTATNLENGSYPCGLCAERAVLARAHGQRPGMPVKRLLLIAGRQGEACTPEPITPCGLCRQSLAEQAERQQGTPLEIMMVGAHRVLHLADARLLLPFAFRLEA